MHGARGRQYDSSRFRERRRGSGQHDAEDLTQGFFAYLLDKDTLKKVDSAKGKFRTFLLAALTNFLANEWDKRKTLKRGGQRQIISLDETVAEELYRHEAVESLTPEKLFERRWASALIEQVLARLKQEHAAGGKADLFAKLEPAPQAKRRRERTRSGRQHRA